MTDISMKLITGDTLEFKDVNHFDLDGKDIVIDCKCEDDNIQNNIFIKPDKVLYIQVKKFIDKSDYNIENSFEKEFAPEHFATSIPIKMRYSGYDSISNESIFECPICSKRYYGCTLLAMTDIFDCISCSQTLIKPN